jgi:hypothetical protein
VAILSAESTGKHCLALHRSRSQGPISTCHRIMTSLLGFPIGGYNLRRTFTSTVHLFRFPRAPSASFHWVRQISESASAGTGGLTISSLFHTSIAFPAGRDQAGWMVCCHPAVLSPRLSTSTHYHRPLPIATLHGDLSSVHWKLFSNYRTRSTYLMNPHWPQISLFRGLTGRLPKLKERAPKSSGAKVPKF